MSQSLVTSQISLTVLVQSAESWSVWQTLLHSLEELLGVVEVHVLSNRVLHQRP